MRSAAFSGDDRWTAEGVGAEPSWSTSAKLFPSTEIRERKTWLITYRPFTSSTNVGHTVLPPSTEDITLTDALSRELMCWWGAWWTEFIFYGDVRSFWTSVHSQQCAAQILQFSLSPRWQDGCPGEVAGSVGRVHHFPTPRPWASRLPLQASSSSPVSGDDTSLSHKVNEVNKPKSTAGTKAQQLLILYSTQLWKDEMACSIEHNAK